MKVLIVTKIFPNGLEPFAAPFNRQQFAELRRFCDVDVLATIPWFPLASRLTRWSPAGKLTGVPAEECIDGLCVRHPRTLFVPRFAPGLSGPLYTASLAPRVLGYRGRVDVVLGSWAYPDGYAAIKLAQLLAVPAVVKLHGSDINVVARMPAPERRLRAALPHAARVVAVSRQLGEKAIALGAAADRVDVVANGVNTELFHPRSRSAARRTLGVGSEKRVILYVGRLEETKGVLDLLAAFEKLDRQQNVELVLLGEGKVRAECDAAALRTPGRIRVLGARPLREVPEWLAACDVLTLPSWNEGMPNVVLEALASGRRVVATRVGAVPDLISSELLGEVVEKCAPDALASALLRAAERDYEPLQVARTAGVRSWRESAGELYDSLLRATGQAPRTLEKLDREAA
ncbi:MAG TPA: glycosyltransferase family 4 protein [Polyangiaceae bacterium]|nr:glycosyltransferase family 4 protein [Polyangiaceae bacterium]